jgi:hypothetical protein
MRLSVVRIIIWSCICLAIGAIVGAGRFFMPFYGPAEMRPGITAKQFVAEVRYGGGKDFEDLTIYPTLEGKNYVTGSLRLGSQPKPFQFNANNPFEFGPAAAGHDIRAFLKDYPKVSYRYAWWDSPDWQGALWGSGAALVSVILVLLQAKKLLTIREGVIDIPIFAKHPAAAQTETKPATSLEGVDDFNTELEKTIEPASDEATMQPTKVPAEPVRKLSPASDERPLVQQHQAPKDYKGEFYPVARSGERKGA